MSQITFPGLTTLLTSPMTAGQTSLPVSSDIQAKLILALGATGYTWLTVVDDLNIEVVKVELVSGALFLTRGNPAYVFPVGACALWEVTDESVQDRVCNPVCELIPACPCAPPMEGATAIPNGMRELPWEGAFNFLGTAPLTLTIVAAPAWVTYTVGSNFVKYSGTPSVAGVYSLSVKATNACGTVTVTKEITIAPKVTDSDDCPTSASTCSGGRLFFTVECKTPPFDPTVAQVENRQGARVTFYAICGPCPPEGCAETIVATPNVCPDTTCTTDSAGVTTCLSIIKPNTKCSVNSLTGIITCITTPVTVAPVDPDPIIPVSPNPVPPPGSVATPAGACATLNVNGQQVTSGGVQDYNSSAGANIAVNVVLARAAVAGTAIVFESWGNYTDMGVATPASTTQTIAVGESTDDASVFVSTTALAGPSAITLGTNGAVRIIVKVPGCNDFTFTMFNREGA